MCNRNSRLSYSTGAEVATEIARSPLIVGLALQNDAMRVLLPTPRGPLMPRLAPGRDENKRRSVFHSDVETSFSLLPTSARPDPTVRGWRPPLA
ncbi:hypothetical protein D3C85_1088850 [compost metagenome]